MYNIQNKPETWRSRNRNNNFQYYYVANDQPGPLTQDDGCNYEYEEITPSSSLENSKQNKKERKQEYRVLPRSATRRALESKSCKEAPIKNMPSRYSSPANLKRNASASNVRGRYKTLSASPYRRMDWHNYHRLSVIHKFLDDLESEFPSICTTGVIGKSLEGRDLKILKISNSNAKNTGIWLDAGIHAREWIGPAVATYVANNIARNFNNLPQYITNKDWYVIPVVNPDGYEYSHTTNRMWRKNRAWANGQCVGVDLNRNFSYGWGGSGSSDSPDHAFYRGPEPFSEPESAAVRDMISKSGLQFKIYITLHSFGQVIIFPLACKDNLCDDYIRLLEGATTMSKAIHDTNGNTYKVGISTDVMYLASGTSNDWSYGHAKIPFCYLIELRSKKHKFKLPKEEIEETGNEILNCLKALVEYVDTVTLKDTNKSLRLKNTVIKVAPKKRNTQVWEVKFIREGQRKFVKNLDTGGAINVWKEERSSMDIMVEGQRAAQVAGMLHEMEIPYSIAIGDVEHLCEGERCREALKNRRALDWNNYYRLNEIYDYMDTLVRRYPYLCSVSVIGKSTEGRDIKLLKISNGEMSNLGVWLDGAIHPREWISVSVCTYIADTIVKRFNEMPECVTNKDWYILPVMNPDGYEYTHTHDRMWRKNRTRYGECVGVDLNRNFSYGWGQNGEEGSSEDPGNIFYRGPKPFSEPETIAVKKAILGCDNPFKVFLSFHSYGEVIIFPWGYTSDPCPDYVELLEGGTTIAKAIFDSNNTTYKVGSTKDLMYFASGTSVDWSYAVANIPYSYMIELKGKKHRFLLPREEILPTVKEVWDGVLNLMKFVDKRCKGTQAGACSKESISN